MTASSPTPTSGGMGPSGQDADGSDTLVICRPVGLTDPAWAAIKDELNAFVSNRLTAREA